MHQRVRRIQSPIKRTCRICNNQAFIFFEDSRPFYLCKNCGVIITESPLTLEEKEQHYQSQHATEFDWNNYAKSILDAVSFAVTPGTILDFGSGSEFLSDALTSMGYAVDSYEPMLHGDFKTGQYSVCYDLVILNEVIEHLVDVKAVIDSVHSVTRPGGIIYIGTLMTDNMMNEPASFHETFGNWWYKDDQTHVSFFCQLTFEYICALNTQHQLRLILSGPGGVILQKI